MDLDLDLDLRGGGRRHGSVSKMVLLSCVLICLVSTGALFTSGNYLDVGSQRSVSQAQEALVGRRRGLSGEPGSHPPLCMGKCGDCTPCSLVHVAVPSGGLVTGKYYPEAWRCKCGNKLYMP